ncbi:MAG: helix-turn-helix domain-containing protein [Apibacter sp.]|uniref:helix-turn-helix domain-containing protein n=1 Tax=Apibacter sp. TaxID=2023709 RepID=UPI0025EDA222|nr:helix-turn-helix transcriptional regulator [Apibacter sp.]MCT6869048.1 helix-turn-helix domain-containing protein [Apibacter sp.]
MSIDAAPKKVHQGRNIKRLREMLGIKQESLAFDLGVSQATVSDYEQKEALDDKILEKVSLALKIPIEAIKNMTDETTNNYINTFYDNSQQSGFFSNPINCNFNPIDKIVELYCEKEELYKKMIKDRDELIEKLSKK